mmetsp:Transcript_28540/g.70646  ORF Transcript_28540/g.70646 Transcript_28540/m.70646 type:complete len:302 (+) Transcript_28540:3-908(+)
MGSLGQQAKAVRERRKMHDVYMNYSEAHGFNHWLPYADVYDKYLPQAEDVEGGVVKMLEIGVQSGGSARMWRTVFGSSLYYVGVDIDIRCTRSENVKEGTFIEIGSQLNRTFVVSVCLKHGPFDLVIDDGGHTAAMIKETFATLFPDNRCMKPNSTYIIEDTHTVKHGVKYSTCPSELYDMASDLWYHQHWRWPRRKRGADGAAFAPPCRAPPHPTFAQSIREVHLFDSMLVVNRAPAVNPFQEINRGTDFFRNVEATLNAPSIYFPTRPLAHGFDSFPWGYQGLRTCPQGECPLHDRRRT